ncbi:MAG: RdgB/HAM1 family non-canonical purine NTP pyrophosphatase [Gammaproteobacteria bacterium]|nr:RdgB/HAM1 family non-canonical purine NTP pyrophosphatase [Gammaproteobacteria bacterium]MBT8150705.1 RdgB/HAM1 family non-canonical purine NTP pyrophosphatase [Gammaproteobacteria bacterium]NND40413.1 RdgB/HAM1 family non-canonical purine NTP pyrophosphatase [Pseudomonadales bacterium]NNM11115.1 RdgB/HAM1 family non-canonical purine NTP pyrophosphatase [Pseudomonadales bacterium]
MSNAARIDKVVIASSNQGKLREFAQLFEAAACKVAPQSDYNVPEAEETGLSFIENAILKARNAALHAGCAALADDSGLAVEYLHGAPGIYSARYSADEVDQVSDSSNNAKLLRALQGVPSAQRGARFICALAFVAHAADPVPLVCTGEWHGLILEAPEGDAGFGYDPLFFVPAFNCSSASLAPEIKNAHSHRGLAVKAMQSELARRGILG